MLPNTPERIPKRPGAVVRQGSPRLLRVVRIERGRILVGRDEDDLEGLARLVELLVPHAKEQTLALHESQRSGQGRGLLAICMHVMKS